MGGITGEDTAYRGRSYCSVWSASFNDSDVHTTPISRAFGILTNVDLDYG